MNESTGDFVERMTDRGQWFDPGLLHLACSLIALRFLTPDTAS
jgi:hypothetical protein